MKALIAVVIASISLGLDFNSAQSDIQFMHNCLRPSPIMAEQDRELPGKWLKKMDVAARPNQHSGQTGSINGLTYSNTDFRFSLKYPKHFVILKQKPSIENRKPFPLLSLNFQDKALLHAQGGYLEPPQFSVEVYEMASDEPLQDWMQKYQMIPTLSDVEPYSLGGHPGLLVKRREFIAPGCFVFVKRARSVFRLTLISDQLLPILDSFRFDD